MRIPKHVAIIPDGNRRWSTENGLAKEEGYNHGLNPGLEVLRMAKQYGIEEITYYGFTTDNCKRPKVQQEAFKKACVDAVKLIESEGNVALLVVGDSTSNNFPKELTRFTTRTTIGRPDIKVNFLVNYGWRWDIAKACTVNTDNNSKPDKFLDFIASKNVSKIDLIIRWGNMRRLSGLLPLQSVYADFYVVESYWPDYKNVDFIDALAWYDKQDVTLGG